MTDAMTRLQCRSVLRGRVWHAITYLFHHNHHSQQAADLTEMKGLMEERNIDGIATFLTSISLKRIDALQRTYFMVNRKPF